VAEHELADGVDADFQRLRVVAVELVGASLLAKAVGQSNISSD
jgi:hypothetical protein